MFIHDKIYGVYVGSRYYVFAIKKVNYGNIGIPVDFKLGKNRKEDLSYIVKYNDMKVNDEQDSRIMS